MALNAGVEPSVMVGKCFLPYINFAIKLIPTMGFRTKQYSSSGVVMNIYKIVRTWRGGDGIINSELRSPALVAV